jgi:hypothetical protein
MVGVKKDSWSKYMYVLQDVPKPEWFFFLSALSLAKRLRKFFHFFRSSFPRIIINTFLLRFEIAISLFMRYSDQLVLLQFNINVENISIKC